MKLICHAFIFAAFVLAPALATATTARTLSIKPNQPREVRGSIDRGAKVATRWANRTSTYCWGAHNNKHFSGNHVLYRTRMPPHAKLIIELQPGARDDLSLYAYLPTKFALPPNVRGISRCQASYLHKINRRSVSTNPGKLERVELKTLHTGSNVVIGVAGAHGATRGSFTLKVTLVQGAAGNVQDTGPVPAMRVHWRSGNTVSMRSNVQFGKPLPLGWANNAPISCWSSSVNRRFSGNHYAWLTVIPARQKMTIELRPASEDLSLYAYTVDAVGNPPLPPRVRQVSRCAASYRGRGTTPERVTLSAGARPQALVIGIAAANGVSKAQFELVLTKSR